MAEKKSLVIKIKRPTLKPEAEIQPAMVTQWHKPRLITAVMLLLGLLTIGVYLLASHPSGENRPAQSEPDHAAKEPRAPVSADTVTNKPASTPQPRQAKPGLQSPNSRVSAEKANELPRAKMAKPPAVNVAKASNRPLPKPLPVKLDSRIKRAVLTQTLNGREPGKAMAGTVTVGKNKPVTVYYFTELRDMAGHKVYHHWLRDGKTVARYAHQVAADRWRTYSHRRLTTKARGAWRVKTTDEQGRLLNEKSFLVK